MTQNILVGAEQAQGAFRKVTLEALSAGRKMAGGLGGVLEAVVMGSGVAGSAAQLAAYGAAKIYVADDAALADAATEAFARVLAQVIEQA
ncbi:MAG: electron transfer flavoprotein subunit alpha/FixB family protein, partial [Desulfobacterales bacterium]|nr:electron transfer flavoprotein subunit alpha/FixB family protein [Desulfobacterales bacterium]